MYNTGDKPMVGLYICANCGEQVYITSEGNSLPLCPNCQESVFFKA